MKREPWAIGNCFAYAIRVLNSIFCRHPEKEGWIEDDREASEEIHWLVVEQINSMCSDMMIDDASDILKMVNSIPTGRLCEATECSFHHPQNPQSHTFCDLFKEKCGECIHNEKSKIEQSDKIEHFEPKK